MTLWNQAKSSGINLCLAPKDTHTHLMPALICLTDCLHCLAFQPHLCCFTHWQACCPAVPECSGVRPRIHNTAGRDPFISVWRALWCWPSRLEPVKAPFSSDNDPQAGGRELECFPHHKLPPLCFKHRENPKHLSTHSPCLRERKREGLHREGWHDCTVYD